MEWVVERWKGDDETDGGMRRRELERGGVELEIGEREG